MTEEERLQSRIGLMNLLASYQEKYINTGDPIFEKLAKMVEEELLDPSPSQR